MEIYLQVYLSVILISKWTFSLTIQEGHDFSGLIQEQIGYPNLTCSKLNKTIYISLDNNSVNSAISPDQIFSCRDGKINILDCYCASYNNSTKTVEFGSCFYNCNRVSQKNLFNIPYKTMKWVNGSNLVATCPSFFNRSGTLCGQCNEGFSPLVYSYELACVVCPNSKLNVFLYILYVYVPLTVFCILIVLLKVNATASHLKGYILVCQGISLPILARFFYITHIYINAPVTQLMNFLTTMYGIWNVDIFRALNRHLCLSLDTLSTFSLDLAVGVFPLLFMTAVYFLSNVNKAILKKVLLPLHSLITSLKIKTSLIDVCGTFLVLSHVKFLNVCFDLLLFTRVYSLSTSGNLTHTLRWYYDANITYFGPKHMPLAILSLAILFMNVILPIFLIVLYPMKIFQSCLNRCSCHWHVLHTYMDLFYASYKDGTEPGTMDFRWFAAVIIGSRCIIFLTGSLTFDALFFSYASTLMVLLALAILLIQPYKETIEAHYYSDLMFILLLATYYVSICSFKEADAKHHREIKFCYGIALLTSFVPFLYFFYLINKLFVIKVVFVLYRKIKHQINVIHRVVT